MAHPDRALNQRASCPNFLGWVFMKDALPSIRKVGESAAAFGRVGPRGRQCRPIDHAGNWPRREPNLQDVVGHMHHYSREKLLQRFAECFRWASLRVHHCMLPIGCQVGALHRTIEKRGAPARRWPSRAGFKSAWVWLPTEASTRA